MMDLINNVPTYAYDYKYIVITSDDKDLYFYGAWNDYVEANRVAIEIGGLVFMNTVE